MNTEHPNIQILKKFDPSNPNSIGKMLAEDFVWHYINPELPDVEGDYFGSSGLTNFFKKLEMGTDGTFKVNPISILPIGDELVITRVRDAMTLNGEPMEIEAVVLWCIIDGEIKEAWDIPILHTANFQQEKEKDYENS